MLRTTTLALLTAGVASHVPVDNPKVPLKKYTIDLDKAPEDRFTEVITDHKQYIKVIVGVLKDVFSSDTDKQLLNATKLSDEYRREIQSIANIVNATYEEALMASMFYELSSVKPAKDLPPEWRNVATRSCTGIVAQNANGSIYHARNQDYPPPFSPLQYDGTFVKGGKVLFEATTFAGIIGIGGTCMVPGGWSVSINARDKYAPSLADAMKYASEGAFSFPLATREGCTRGGDFNAGVKFLSEVPMISPGYFIMAGASPGEGVILTRNSTGEDTDFFRLSDAYPKTSPWFIVQTNYDHWDKAPIYDDRRDMGIKLMEAVGQNNVSIDTLWNVMSDTGNGIIGVYNQATIHTELIDPSIGEYHTYLRHNIISDVIV